MYSVIELVLMTTQPYPCLQLTLPLSSAALSSLFKGWYRILFCWNNQYHYKVLLGIDCCKDKAKKKVGKMPKQICIVCITSPKLKFVLWVNKKFKQAAAAIHNFHLISQITVLQLGEVFKKKNGDFQLHLPLSVGPRPPFGTIFHPFFTPTFFCNWILLIWNGFYTWS